VNTTVSKCGVYFTTAGSSTFRIAIYRGSDTSATLVGLCPATIVNTSGYMTATITAEIGQNLTFTAGQQIVVLYTISGISSVTTYYNGTSDINIAWRTTGYTTTFSPMPLKTGGATPVRISIDIA
jgi:hypothetical protein